MPLESEAKFLSATEDKKSIVFKIDKESMRKLFETTGDDFDKELELLGDPINKPILIRDKMGNYKFDIIFVYSEKYFKNIHNEDCIDAA